jgi:hypothetical protein
MSDDPTTVLVDVDELENRDGIGVGDDVINVDDLLGSAGPATFKPGNFISFFK